MRNAQYASMPEAGCAHQEFFMQLKRSQKWRRLLALLRPREMSDLSPQSGGDLNRSTQHLLILLDKEVADGDVTDIVHGEAEG